MTDIHRRPLKAEQSSRSDKCQYLARRQRCWHLEDRLRAFNCNNFNIRYWSWNYRGCWHQNLPSNCSSLSYLDCSHFNLESVSPELLFLVTTSPNWDWVICAPAAFLRSGSRFSGSLSANQTLIPRTCNSHGSPIHYHQSDRAETWMI